MGVAAGFYLSQLQPKKLHCTVLLRHTVISTLEHFLKILRLLCDPNESFSPGTTMYCLKVIILYYNVILRINQNIAVQFQNFVLDLYIHRVCEQEGYRYFTILYTYTQEVI